jgi:hypothetical protein
MDDPENGEQLAKELASYQKKQPWREKQDVAESGDKSTDKSVPEVNQDVERSIDF